MPDFKAKVLEQEKLNSSLTSRMDNDENLVYLFEYVMRDTNLRRVPDIINVTLNRPAVYAANIIAAMGSTSEQRMVETDDKNLDTTEVEAFQNYAFTTANYRLRRQGKTQINPFTDTQLCIRGGAAALCVFQMVDDELIADIVPWDKRFVTYEIGIDGIDWAGYKVMMAKDDIAGQSWAKDKDFTIATHGAEILDAWHTEGHEVWVAGKKVHEEEHAFGFTPVAIETVPLGYGTILLGKDRIKNEGESIFFLIRGVIPELNRLASIMQTMNLKSVRPPVAQKIAGKAKAKKYEDVMGIGSNTAMEPADSISPISFGDAQRSATLALGLLDDAIGEGSLSSADLGRIGSPPASGIRAIIAGENRDQIIQPRLEAKALLNESLTWMFTKQVIQIGGSVELGTPGHKRTFQVSKIDGEYETTYKYTAQSPITDAGRYSLAAAAGNMVSEKYKATHILQLEDPDGDQRQKDWEKAGRINPIVEQRRIIKSLIEMGEEEEAKLILDAMGVSLKQLLAGEAAEVKPLKEDEPTQVLSLFGGQSGAPQARTEEQK